MSNKYDPSAVLAERFAKRAAAGLKDVKFCLQNVDDVQVAEVHEEVNRLYAAIEAGKVEPLKFGDLRWAGA
jgi:hypothetical protein